MNQKTMPAYLFVVSLFLVAGFASMVAVAKNDNAGNDNAKSEKTEKASQTEKSSQAKKTVTKANLKNYEKPDTAKGETNATVHKEKSTEIAKNLKKATAQVETATETQEQVTNLGTETAVTEEVSAEIKTKAKKRIQEIAAEQITTQTQTAEAIDEVEEDGAVKKFFFGPDYKNLGQLRSALVQNRNQIRKLNQAIGLLNGASSPELNNQLTLLTQEEARLKEIIVNNQETFSLLGWAFKFMNGYQETPVTEAEEDSLIDQVAETVTDTTTGTENTTPTTDTTTPTTDTTTTPDTTTDTTTLTTVQ